MSFLGLNTMTGTGSRSATGDISQLGVVNFNSMMDGFAQHFKRQVFRRLWLWNKDSFPGSNGQHNIRFTEVSKDYALTDLGAFLTAYHGAFALGGADDIALRKRSGFMPENPPDPDEITTVAPGTGKGSGTGSNTDASGSENKMNLSRRDVQLAFQHANRQGEAFIEKGK